MKKYKFSWKGFVALIVFVFAMTLLFHDFAMLMLGYTFTWSGLATLGAVLIAGVTAEGYLHDRINK